MLFIIFRLAFFAFTGERPKILPGDKVEFEFEFSDGKRKAPQVRLLESANPNGGGGAMPPVQRVDSRGVPCFPIRSQVTCLSLPRFRSLALRFVALISI